MLVSIFSAHKIKVIFSVYILLSSASVVGMVPSLDDESVYPFNKTVIDQLPLYKKHEFDNSLKFIESMLSDLQKQKFVSHFDIDKLNSVKIEIALYIDKLQDYNCLLKQSVQENSFKIDIDNYEHIKQAKLLVRSLLLFYTEIVNFNKYPHIGYTSTQFPFLNPVIEKTEKTEQPAPSRPVLHERKFIQGILCLPEKSQHKDFTVDGYYACHYLEE